MLSLTIRGFQIIQDSALDSASIVKYILLLLLPIRNHNHNSSRTHFCLLGEVLANGSVIAKRNQLNILLALRGSDSSHSLGKSGTRTFRLVHLKSHKSLFHQFQANDFITSACRDVCVCKQSVVRLKS